MDFEDGPQLTIQDTPKVCLLLAALLLLWSSTFGAAPDVVAQNRLQSFNGTINHVEQSSSYARNITPTARYRHYRSGQPGGTSVFFPGHLGVFVDLGGRGVSEFEVDRALAERAPGLAELQGGNDVTLLVQQLPSGESRLWQLSHNGVSVLSYDQTRSYIEATQSNPRLWERVVAFALLLVAGASAWLLRGQKPATTTGMRTLRPPRADPTRWTDPDRDAPAAPPFELLRNPVRDPQRAEADVHHGQDVLRAAAGNEALPSVLAEAASSPEQALPLLLALLLDEDLETRIDQQQRIGELFGEATLASMKAVAPSIVRLTPMQLLPLAELTFPVLRQLPSGQATKLLSCVEAMVRVDGVVNLFKYLLCCMLRRQLANAPAPSAEPHASPRKLHDLRREIALLMSTIAYDGQNSHAEAQRAYTIGMSVVLPHDPIASTHPAADLSALDAAWDQLDALDNIGKSTLIDGVIATIGMDGQVMVTESELLHAVCTLLHRPVPSMPEFASGH